MNKTFVIGPKGEENRVHTYPLNAYAANTPRLVSTVSPMSLNAVQTDSETGDKER